MPDITADQIITLKHTRGFIQQGGAGPANPVRLAGLDRATFAITGVSNPVSGGIDPIRAHDPRRPGQYTLLGRSISPPDLPGATLMTYERHGGIPYSSMSSGCPISLYALAGTCKDPSDFDQGWNDYVVVIEDALVTDRNLGDIVTMDSDEARQAELTLVPSRIYPVGQLSLGEGASTQVTSEVKDIVYGTRVRCADCGLPNDGTQWVYAVSAFLAPSATNPTEVNYSTDGGSTWTGVTLGTGDDTPVAIDIVGERLIVIATDRYFYADINTQTGAPGAFTTVTPADWSTNNAADVYVASPREVFVVAANGHIYSSADITAGFTVLNDAAATSETLTRIHGQDETLVAVGENGTVVQSVNRGRTWSTTATNPSADTVQAIAVLNARRWWVGTSGGEMYYTETGGQTWTAKAFDGSGSGAVHDIIAVTSGVLYMSHSTTAPAARVFATFNGGYSWSRGGRMLTRPEYDRANRLAAPIEADVSVAVNNLAVAGLAGDGSDGVIYIAAAAIV